jgi:hypothetical protein
METENLILKPLKPIQKGAVKNVSIKVACKICKKRVYDEQGKNKPALFMDADGKENKCKHPASSQFYLARYAIPGMGENRKTPEKKLISRNIQDAIKEAERLKQINTYVDPAPLDGKVEIPLLTDAIKTYLRFKSNIDKETPNTISKPHFNELEKTLKRLLLGLEEQKFNVYSLRVNQITKEMASKICTYFLNIGVKASHKKTIEQISSFFNFLYEYKEIEVKNPFKGQHIRNLKKKPSQGNKIAISPKSFLELMKVMQGTDAYVNTIDGYGVDLIHRNWLSKSFYFSVFTGRRREEIIELLKWNSFKKDENGLLCFFSPNVKNNKRNGILQDEQIVKIPVYPEFKAYLESIGLNEKIGLDEHILENHFEGKEFICREQMIQKMTKAFQYFIKYVTTPEELSYKSMRKLFTTTAFTKYGEMANFITGHAQIGTGMKHYFAPAEFYRQVAEHFHLGIFDNGNLNFLRKVA